MIEFPLTDLPTAIAARAQDWARAGIAWRLRPTASEYEKSVIISEFESDDWLGDIMIWVTGEAELQTVRLRDDRIVNKHYDLSGRADLEALLAELVALLLDDELPAAAVIVG
jgi:hypothetical protein